MTVDAGVPTDVQVFVTDASYLGTVHFTASDPLATLPTDYGFTGADAGLKVFAKGVTLRTAGVQTVTAVDVHTAVVLNVFTFVVLADQAATLQLILPIALRAGQLASVTLRALDVYGNLAEATWAVSTLPPRTVPPPCRLITPLLPPTAACTPLPMGLCFKPQGHS